MKREFLKGLGLEKEVIDSIMSENGVDIQREKDKYTTLEEDLTTANTAIHTYETKLKAFENVDVDKLNKQIIDLQKEIEDKKIADNAAKEDKLLTDNILESIKEKQFVNDYTKNSIIADVKSQLALAENKGKGISELFEALTKDKEGIFANQNPAVNMAGVGNVQTVGADDGMRAAMGLPPTTK